MNQIASTAILKENVKIGDNVIIKDFVVIYPGVVIEDNVEIMEGAIIGRIPKGAKATARKTIDEFKTVKIGNGTVISPHAVIYTDVSIGQGTLIGDGASIREGCVIGDNCIISRYVTVNYDTVIGDRAKIMDNTHITGRAKIGNDVFISVNVSTVNDNLFGKAGFNDNIEGQIIKDFVSVGPGVILLSSISIGRSSIITGGSVVKKDFPDSVIISGNPAKIVNRVPSAIKRE